MKGWAFAVVGACVVGCTGDVTYNGIDLTSYFPFDGDRTWEYVNSDEAVSYTLLSTLQGEPSSVGDDLVYTVTTERRCADGASDCVDGAVRAVGWTVDRAQGARIRALDGTPFEPAVAVADPNGFPGDSVVTESAGATWTSTYEGLGSCPVLWTDTWGDQCARFTLDTDPAEHSLAGTYWTITQYGVVAFQLTGDPGVWQLVEATYSEE